jgi:hypothetical protein
MGPRACPRRRAALGAAVALALVACAPAGARAAGFVAGAAVIDTSPRAAGADDPNGFGACATAMTGPRAWADDEPYVDVNGNGAFDHGEPYCDHNANGRHDQIYDSGADIGSPRPARAVHDPLHARALAISEGGRTVVLVTVSAQGLFQNYTDRMTARARELAPQITDMIVSADHNESSPDTIGIYGGPAPSVSPPDPIPGAGSPAGAQSGIDDYYMDFLVERVAQVAAAAARALRPATLLAGQFSIAPPLSVRLSDNWPTTDNSTDRPAAIDPKAGVLQALDASGAPIFTALSVAAHNQEIGHSGTPDLSADWPGYFANALETRLGGTAAFLVGDNGSEEDPQTTPAAGPSGSYAQAQATGEAFAAAVAAHVATLQPLRGGAVALRRTDLCVPLENNIFKAAAAAGLFGQRPGYTQAPDGSCVPTGAGPAATGAPTHLLSSVAVLDVGPDLEIVANPGEAFPALMLGSPWGLEDVPTECQGRANPPVPTWRSHAAFRLQLGLANDMIGYQIPAWAYIGPKGTFTTSDPACQANDPNNPDPTAGTDSAGHHHKLETEGIGPTASNAVAAGLTDLVGAAGADVSARVAPGRFVTVAGAYARSAAGAAGMLVPAAGATALDPSAGLLVGAPGTQGFGGRAVDATGLFMDYDGQPQAAPDITTRGMVVFDARGCVSARYYLDVFPPLDGTHPPGAAQAGPVAPPTGDCSPQPAGVAGVQLGARDAVARALPGFGVAAASCARAATLRTVVRHPGPRRAITVRSGRRLVLRGRTTVSGCAAVSARVARVAVAIFRRAGRRCRFARPDGRLTPPRSCARPLRLLARGTARWTLRLRGRLPRGRYVVVARAVNAAGRREPRRRANVVRLRVRR